MKTLRLASFGIRGYVGESLDPQVLIDFAAAYATFVEGGKILLGRDTRYSSRMIHAAVVAGLTSAGCEVVDFDVCPTPILQFCVRPYEAAGAVSISGGHNGMGWNSVSLTDRFGAFVDPAGGELILDSFHAGEFLKRDWQSIGPVSADTEYASIYFQALENAVNADAIRAAGFSVVIDPVGGAGCAFLQEYANLFNLNLIPVNGTPSGYLAREPEPRPRAGVQIASIIQRLGAHAGFLFSSDMGRLSLVTAAGEPLSEEMTFPVILQHFLRKTPGPVVTNICTTMTVDDLASYYKVPLFKSAVGQAYVMGTMVDENAVIGGEGSGSVAIPSFSRGFDGFLMMTLILEAMAESGYSLEDLAAALPRYHIVKRGVACQTRDVFRIVEGVREKLIFDIVEMDLTDGLRMRWQDGWIHVRASKTQQMIRVISESASMETAQNRAEEVTRIVAGLI